MLGYIDPWVKTFQCYISQGHIFEAKGTGHGRISLYKHIHVIKLQISSALKPLGGFDIKLATMILE